MDVSEGPIDHRSIIGPRDVAGTVHVMYVILQPQVFFVAKIAVSGAGDKKLRLGGNLTVFDETKERGYRTTDKIEFRIQQITCLTTTTRQQRQTELTNADY